MRLLTTLSLLALAAADCSIYSYDQQFEITVVKPVNAVKKRQVSTCDKPGILTLNLASSVLHDSDGRTGYITDETAHEQFQFDKPVQAGALYTSGFSLCNNGSIALQGTANFYQCQVGGFYNLYYENWMTYCELVNIDIIPCNGQTFSPTTTSSTVSSSIMSSTTTSSTTSSTTTSSTTFSSSTTSTTSSSITTSSTTTSSITTSSTTTSSTTISSTITSSTSTSSTAITSSASSTASSLMISSSRASSTVSTTAASSQSVTASMPSSSCTSHFSTGMISSTYHSPSVTTTCTSKATATSTMAIYTGGASSIRAGGVIGILDFLYTL